MAEIRLSREAQTGNDPTGKDQIRVLLADPDPISRHVLGNVLSDSTSIRLIASVDAQRPVKEWPVEQSNVVVLSAGQPTDQTHVIEALVTAGVQLLLMYSHWTSGRLSSAIASGAAGCLVKQVDVAHLVPAVVAVASGNIVLSQELAALHVLGGPPNGYVTARDGDRQRIRERLGALTSREREVLSLLAGGMTTTEVADTLVISPATVKSHVSHSLPKLGVRNRMEAVLLAQHASRECSAMRPAR